MTRWDSDFSLVSRKFCSFLYHFLQNIFVRWFMFYASVFMIKLWVSRFFAKHWVLYCSGCLLEYWVWVGIEFHSQPFLFKPAKCFKCMKCVFIFICHLANSLLSLMVVKVFHRNRVSIPTATMQPAMPRIVSIFKLAHACWNQLILGRQK